jgi:sugar phosphate isomerase/epimerase
MHLSTHNWMRPEPLETTLARIQRLGYESIEIADPCRHELTATEALLKRYCIRCWGGVTLMLGARNLAAQDGARRASSVQYVKEIVQRVSDLGGEIVTIVPVTVGKLVPECAPEDEWAWVRDGLQEVNDLAKRVGIRLAIEPLNRFETYFINRTDQALAMAEAVGPNCGICLDTFHLNIEEANLLEAIRLGRGKIYDFHVADNNRLAPGQGALDWHAIVKALKSVGYNGALAAEFLVPTDRTPKNRYSHEVQDKGSSVMSEEFCTALAAKTAETLIPLIHDTVAPRVGLRP